MARRLVWMPVLPRVTVSVALNLPERAGRASGRSAKAAGWIQAAPAAQAVRWMKSRRFMRPPYCSVLVLVHLLIDARSRRWVIRRTARVKFEELHSRETVPPRPIYRLRLPVTPHARRAR